VTFRFETKAQIVWLGDGGIIRATSKPRTDLTLEDAQEFIREIGLRSPGKRHPILVNLVGLKSMSRDARTYFAGAETAKVELAAALLVDSPMARAIGNFFMGLNKSLVPSKLFTSEALALEWLAQYVQ
jgi:hypothetical protein